jgi:K+-transporting ATPase KdpF subunit
MPTQAKACGYIDLTARRDGTYGRRLDCHNPAVLRHLPGLCRFPGQGGQDVENLIAGLVAAALIIYLFVVLLRPHKF